MYLHWIIERLGQDQQWYVVADKGYSDALQNDATTYYTLYPKTPSYRLGALDPLRDEAFGCGHNQERGIVLTKHPALSVGLPSGASAYVKDHWDYYQNDRTALALFATSDQIASLNATFPSWCQDLQAVLEDAHQVLPFCAGETFGDFPDLNGSETHHQYLERLCAFAQLTPAWRVILLYSDLGSPF